MANTPFEFKGLTGWVEVFKAGSHTNSKGRSCRFTEGDLGEMVSNLALGSVPAVLGHPKHNDPAYAWVKPDDAKVADGSLYVKFSDINPAFQSGVESGAYRNRSVSVFQDKDAGWRLRHVGWLGAAPPAIDGLAPLDYSAEVDAYEFDAGDWDVGYALGDTAEMLRSLREQLIAKDGLDAADAALPNWRIQSIADAAERVKAAARAEAATETPETPANPLFSQPDNAGDVMSFTQEQVDAAAAKARKEAEDAAAAQFSAAQAQLTQLRGERRSERVAANIAAWKAKGVVTPAEEAGLAEFMASLEDGGVDFSFTAADNAVVKKTPAQYFADFMAARKPMVKLGVQQMTQGVDPVDSGDASAIADRAREYMKAQGDKGLVVSLPEAVARVSAGAV